MSSLVHSYRTEYQGIGIFVNKKAAPDFETVELVSAIAGLDKPGRELEGFRTRTSEQIGELCRKAGGKRTAVDKILEIARDVECGT